MIVISAAVCVPYLTTIITRRLVAPNTDDTAALLPGVSDSTTGRMLRGPIRPPSATHVSCSATAPALFPERASVPHQDLQLKWVAGCSKSTSPECTRPHLHLRPGRSCVHPGHTRGGVVPMQSAPPGTISVGTSAAWKLKQVAQDFRGTAVRMPRISLKPSLRRGTSEMLVHITFLEVAAALCHRQGDLNVWMW